MKRVILYITAVALLNIVAVEGTLAKTRKAGGKGGNSVELTILHSNDTHSCILPLSENLADTAMANRAGFLRRITLLKEEREKDPDLLFFDSGDFSQGSPFYTMYQGDVEIGLMNMMHLDASTIGNHEWDFGMENFARLIRMANFPILCSNYDFKGTELDGLIKPYTIINRKGVKIGVFAVCPKLEGLVSTKNYTGVVYNDPVDCALRTATMLKKQEKCDLVVCISHLGWDEEGDIPLIKGSRYIDIVLGGHSHSYFKELRYVKDLDGREVPVDQNGKHAIYVGKIKMTLEQ